MRITRTIQGVEITLDLTDDELYKAWLEQEDKFDKNDVDDWIDDLTEEDALLFYGVSTDFLRKHADTIACRYKDFLYANDMIHDLEYDLRGFAAKEVIKEVCQK